MLKRMLKMGYINIDKFLLENYIELNLNESELLCLMMIVSYYEKGKNIGFSTLKGKTRLSNEELSSSITSLIDKGFIDTMQIIKNGKESIAIDVGILADKIFDYINDLNKKENESKMNDFMKSVIDIIETEFSRELSPNELQIISEWYGKYSVDDVRNALFLASSNDKLSLQYMDRVINNGNN